MELLKSIKKKKKKKWIDTYWEFMCDGLLYGIKFERISSDKDFEDFGVMVMERNLNGEALITSMTPETHFTKSLWAHIPKFLKKK